MGRDGYAVNIEMTKVAGEAPDVNHEYFQAPINYVASMAKVAACASIGLKLLAEMETMDNYIQKAL
jgi:hypothetical protein